VSEIGNLWVSNHVISPKKHDQVSQILVKFVQISTISAYNGYLSCILQLKPTSKPKN